MSRKKAQLLALLLAALALAGCAAVKSQQEQYLNPIRFYYLSREGGHNAETGALDYQTVDLVRNDRAVADIAAEYLKGPTTWVLASPFPDGTSCEAVWLEDGVLYLRMSQEYAQLAGIRLTMANACLTLTMMQLDFVQSVRIETSGSMLSNQNEAAFTADSFLLADRAAQEPVMHVTVYFADRESGLLRAEERQIAAVDDADAARLALDALLLGPASDALESTIPSGTQCVDLRVSDGTCTVVLSESFVRCDSDAVSAETAVRCIVATLCAQDGVERVNLSLLSGGNLKNIDLMQTFTPQSEWYAK